jgi:formylglycine-generating enzyme required for sulfatase activity
MKRYKHERLSIRTSEPAASKYKWILLALLAGVILFTTAAVMAEKKESSTQKQKKLFIKTLTGEGVNKQLLERIRGKILSTIMDLSGDEYNILDDDTVIAMYDQAKKIMASGCNDESCISQIAEGINADVIIHGEVSVEGSNITISIKRVDRNKKTLELGITSRVSETFKESQTEWFAEEAAKQLMNPKYKIDKSKAPSEYNANVDIKSIKINGSEKFNVQVLQFETDDTTLQSILDIAKKHLIEGDDFFAKKEYEKAINKYKEVIEKIDKKLTAENKEKIKTFREEVVNRCDTAYAMLYKLDMEDVDKKLKSENNADEKYLNEIIEKYNDLAGDINKKTPSEFYGENTRRINKAVTDRIDSCYVAICGLHEKLGDAACGDYNFDKGYDEYSKAFNTAEKIKGDTRESIVGRYNIKLEATQKTGENYLVFKIKSYIDRAQIYNFNDKTTEAKDMLKEARKYMIGGMSRFLTIATVEKYNAMAKVLDVKLINESTEPKLFASIREKNFYNMEFVLITGGTFTMGSPEIEQGEHKELSIEEKQHTVTVSSFWMGKYEVTQGEYEDVMGINPSTFKKRNLPINVVNWYDSVEFCNKMSEKHGLKPYYNIDKNRKDPNNTNQSDNIKWTVTIAGGNGFRLPTEAEWEYACRAGTTTAFCYGNSLDSSMANFDGNYPYKSNKGVFRDEATEVGNFKPNAWGLYDMHGNVDEWCWDWYEEYNNVVYNPRGADSGKERVKRGGSLCDEAFALRSASRFRSPAFRRSGCGGFRVVRSAF